MGSRNAGNVEAPVCDQSESAAGRDCTGEWLDDLPTLIDGARAAESGGHFLGCAFVLIDVIASDYDISPTKHIPKAFRRVVVLSLSYTSDRTDFEKAPEDHTDFSARRTRRPADMRDEIAPASHAT